jgi:hypothetical protein
MLDSCLNISRGEPLDEDSNQLYIVIRHLTFPTVPSSSWPPWDAKQIKLRHYRPLSLARADLRYSLFQDVHPARRSNANHMSKPDPRTLNLTRPRFTAKVRRDFVEVRDPCCGYRMAL